MSSFNILEKFSEHKFTYSYNICSWTISTTPLDSVSKINFDPLLCV